LEVVPTVLHAEELSCALLSIVKGGNPPNQLIVTELPVRVSEVITGSGESPLAPEL
jgi:hypothetical protein